MVGIWMEGEGLTAYFQDTPRAISQIKSDSCPVFEGNIDVIPPWAFRSRPIRRTDQPCFDQPALFSGVAPKGLLKYYNSFIAYPSPPSLWTGIPSKVTLCVSAAL